VSRSTRAVALAIISHDSGGVIPRGECLLVLCFYEKTKDLIKILLTEAQNACGCGCTHYTTLHSNTTLHAYTYVGIYILCMCVSIIQEEES